jgi:lambda repressor-like predicted transcriptional regulator
LFTAIRGEARRGGWSIRALADRHGVHRRTVQRALTSPVPPPRKQQQARGSRLDPFKQIIDAILQADRGSRYAGRLSIQSIYATLVDEHGMAGVSYSTLRDYVTNHCRRFATTTPPATAIGPIHQAIEQQDLDLLRDLLDAGHDIDNSDDDGLTLLRRAIAVEHERHLQTGEPLHADMTAFLLARGANPARVGSDGTTPLHDAESRGHWLAAEIIRSWTAHAVARVLPCPGD